MLTKPLPTTKFGYRLNLVEVQHCKALLDLYNLAYKIYLALRVKIVRLWPKFFIAHYNYRLLLLHLVLISKPVNGKHTTIKP